MLLPLLLALAVPDPALVVVNKTEHSVSVIDLATGRNLVTLPTGHGPHEVAASADGRWAVVTDYGSQTPSASLTVVDLTTLQVARTIRLDSWPRPHGIWFLADNITVAVTSEVSQAVVLVDVVEGRVVGTAPTGQAASHMVAVSPDGRNAYTANINPGTLSALKIGGDPVAAKTLRVGTQTEAINLTPDGRQVWIGSNNTGKVYVVELARWAVVDSIQTSGFPYRIAFTPDGGTAIVTNPQADQVQLVDTRTREKLATVPMPGGALGVAVSPDGATAWITLAGANEVAELDLKTRAVVRRIPTGAGPDGVAYVVR
jgi:YVTN family beta-propeller protein